MPQVGDILYRNRLQGSKGLVSYQVIQIMGETKTQWRCQGIYHLKVIEVLGETLNVSKATWRTIGNNHERWHAKERDVPDKEFCLWLQEQERRASEKQNEKTAQKTESFNERLRLAKILLLGVEVKPVPGPFDSCTFTIHSQQHKGLVHVVYWWRRDTERNYETGEIDSVFEVTIAFYVDQKGLFKSGIGSSTYPSVNEALINYIASRFIK